MVLTVPSVNPVTDLKSVKCRRLKGIQDISKIYQKPVCDFQALPETPEGGNLYHPSKREDIRSKVLTGKGLRII